MDSDEARALLDALERIVAAWDGISPDADVPDGINDTEMWDEARRAIRRAKLALRGDVPDIFEEKE